MGPIGAESPAKVSLHLAVASQRRVERGQATARADERAEITFLPARAVEAVKEFIRAAIVMMKF